jgi:hypothetical protein
MGEVSPPTAADYARQMAGDAGTQARDAIMQVQALERRVKRLEIVLKRVIELVDEGVSGLSSRILALENPEYKED